MEINLAYVMNKKYEKWFILSLHSVMRCNKNIHLFLYSTDLNSLKDKMKEIQLIYPQLKITYIEDERINSWLNMFDDSSRGYQHVTKEAYLRLFFPDLLPGVRKIIYFDCDIINCACLDKIWNMDFEKNYFLGCRGYEFSDVQAKELKHDYYVLSGMLVMDLERLRKEDSFTIIKDNFKGALALPRVPSADETVLNVLFYNKIKLISEAWNYCHNREYGTRKIQEKDVKNWHVCGPDKSKMFSLYVSKTCQLLR